jgi:16S rRNA (cytidine1402-2'-O)-methyltransferase
VGDESSMDKDSSNSLFVVATPIGNLNDITVRAIETLRGVNVIACEDTRTSRVLLNRWNISTPLISLHRFNENRKTQTILERLGNGESVALISDAGTPNISDPGYRLVRSVMDAGYRVVPIPGPSSIIAALSVAGIDGSAFVFLGFSPKKESALRSFFENIGAQEHTIVFLETARRIVKTIDMARKVIPNRQFVLGRELTKKFEEIISGDPESVHEQLSERQNIKGEFVVVIEPSKLSSVVDIDEVVMGLIKEGYTGKNVADEAQRRFRVSKSAAYSKYLSIVRAKSHSDESD